MLVNVFGKRGSGKTFLIRRTIKYCEAPIVIIDLLGNFGLEHFPKSYQTESISDCCEKIVEYNQYQAADKNTRAFMDEIPSVIVIQPDDPNEAIDYISALMWEEWAGGTLVIDEADGFSYDQAKYFSKLIRYGRNRGIHLLTGCRRPAELDRNITAGANSLYIFQTQEPRDVEYYSKTLLGKEQAESLKSLPDYHGLFINYDKKTTGVFKTDERGDVIILKEKPMNQNQNEIDS